MAHILIDVRILTITNIELNVCHNCACSIVKCMTSNQKTKLIFDWLIVPSAMESRTTQYYHINHVVEIMAS